MHRYRLHGCLTAVVFFLGLVGAQTASFGEAQNLRGHRLVHRFDFEEAQFNNFEEMPMHWYAIGRPADTAVPTFLRQPLHHELAGLRGFPRHAAVRFDRPQSQPGPHRLYLELNGGNAGAFLEVGALPAVPGSDYVVTAKVRTSGLEHAASRLVVYLIDRHGRRINDSVASTAGVRTGGQWQTVSVKLRGDFADAAWIGMQVELAQAAAQNESRLGRHQVIYRDVYGEAWFDDIAVWQMPRMEIRTQSPVNVIRYPDRPRLNMRVRDLTGQELVAQVRLHDHRHRVVASDQQDVGRGLSESWYWDPSLDRFGWYLVEMTAYESKGSLHPVARALSAFLWLPPEPAIARGQAQRFFLFAEEVPDAELRLIPQLLRDTGVGSVLLSAWDLDTSEDDLERQQVALDELIQQTRSLDKQVALSLSPVPQRLAHDLDIDVHSPISIFAHPSEAWLAYLSPVLLRQGQMVRQWQLGSVDQAHANLIPDLPQTVGSIRGVIKDWAPRPQIVLPWRLLQARPAETASDMIYAIDVPAAVRPDTIGEYTAEWSDVLSDSVRLNLRVPSATRMSHARRIEDLALRMLYAWQTNAAGLALTRQWTDSRDRPLTLIPDPVLGVFASVKQRLAGRQAIGELPIADGVRGIVFDGPAGGMVAAWNESSPPQQAKIDLYLGEDPAVFDVWGNRYPVPVTQGRHQIPLSTTPLLIEGIDPQLALLRASFKVDRPFIESTGVPHERVIMFTNPWSRTMAGTLTITHPQKWTITPRIQHYSVGPGQTVELPVRIQFPVSEVAGDKKLRARFEFDSTEHYEVIMATSLEMGLTDIELDASLTLVPGVSSGQEDAVVTQMVTNKGEATRSLNVFAIMPGHPRQERMIVGIEPGQTVVRRFRFTAAAADVIRSTIIRVGLRELSGPAVLNQILSFH